MRRSKSFKTKTNESKMRKMSAKEQSKRPRNAVWPGLWKKSRLRRKKITKIKKRGFRRSSVVDGKKKMRLTVLSTMTRREALKKTERRSLKG